MQAAIVTFFVLLSVVLALDVKLEKATCDNSLPVTADIYMKCDNGARCTFGDVVTIYGTLKYNNVDNSGIQNNLAYLTSNLELWTLDFNLFDMLPVPLCDDTMTADSSNQNACPGSGSYDFSITYSLPSAGSEHTSWLASGWNGDGLIQMFAETDETMKIGECHLDLQTFVTRKNGSSSLLQFPSAAVASGLFLALFAILILVLCYCMLCRRRRAVVVDRPAEEVSYFSKLEDAKSTRSRGSSKKSKKTATSESSIVSDLI